MTKKSSLMAGIFFLIGIVVQCLAQTVDVAAQRVNAATQRAIVQQLVRDRGITAACVRESRGASKVVSITPIVLNRAGKSGFIVDGEGTCTYGANSPYGWVYSKNGNGYKMLLDAGPNQGISRKRSLTNGYYDIEVTQLGNYSSNWKAQSTTYKFNGTRYK